MANLFVLPFRPAYDGNGKVIPGAQARFTLTGTNAAADVYADAALTTPHASPVVANAVGRWPEIYLDEAVTYRVRIYDADANVLTDTPIEEYDPYTPGTILGGSAYASGTDAINVFDYMTPEERDDVTAGTLLLNVTQALQAASAALQAAGGGELFLPPGKYLVVEQTLGGTLLDGVTPAAWGPEEIITVKNCPRPIKISGYGAVLVAADGYRFGAFDPVTGNPHPSVVPFYDYNYYAYPYRGMVNVEGNASVTIEGLELDGNSANATIGGEWGDSHWQLEGHGIAASGNNRLTVRDVYCHDHPCDGMVMANGGITEASAPRPALMENSSFVRNARQGLSLVGGKQVVCINCEFSHTGTVTNIGLGALLQTSPGCGVDLEAESSLIRDVDFINCRFMNNWAQRSIGASSGSSARVSFRSCIIEDILIGRPAYHFTDCVIVGRFNVSVAFYNHYKPYSAVDATTLTIAGAGPTYTITRAAGSFITDGFKTGDKVCLYGPGTLDVANQYRPLLVVAITATVLTVIPTAYPGLFAQGPIAGCTVYNAHTEEDGITFERTLFTRDPAYLEGGTMYASQSLMTEALFCTFRQCTFDTYDVPLPNFYPSYAAPSPTEPQAFYPVYEDCIFRTASASAGVTGLCGHFRGVNRITAPAAAIPIFAFGSLSRIDYGAVYFNGVAQGVQAYTLTNVTTDRALDADAATVLETNDVLATLVSDLRTRNIVG